MTSTFRDIRNICDNKVGSVTMKVGGLWEILLVVGVEKLEGHGIGSSTQVSKSPNLGKRVDV